MNINNLHRIEDDKVIGLNDIANIYQNNLHCFMIIENKGNTGIILIDESTNETCCGRNDNLTQLKVNWDIILNNCFTSLFQV